MLKERPQEKKQELRCLFSGGCFPGPERLYNPKN